MKVEKPDPCVAASVGERDTATNVQQEPSYKDADMPLGPKIESDGPMVNFHNSVSMRSLKPSEALRFP